MFFFRQFNFRTVDECGNNDQDDRSSEHDEFEVRNITCLQGCSRSFTRHADPNSRQTDDTARDSTGKFINERSYTENQSFVAMAEFELAVFDRIRDRHKNDEEERTGLRQRVRGRRSYRQKRR